MEDYINFKLKRKDLEEVNHDFSDFSLSSPARKIRRLDADLPPIIEEEEVNYPLGYGQSVTQNTISNGFQNHVKPVVIEELPSVPENEEKAIVLFNPVNGLSQGRFSVDPNLISCFKNQAFYRLNVGRPREEDEAMENDNNGEENANACRAVIPWAPSLTLDPVSRPQELAPRAEVSDAMDGAASMEIDDADAANVGHQASDCSNFSGLQGGLQHQWHPQYHCMILQAPPQNIASPVVWYR